VPLWRGHYLGGTAIEAGKNSYTPMVTQVCETLLHEGVEAYKNEGPAWSPSKRLGSKMVIGQTRRQTRKAASHQNEALRHSQHYEEKDAPLAFRISSELQKKLQQIADREARSIAQICEILLTIGTETYGKEGSKYLHRYFRHRKEG
jgi:hypothetical protein